MTLRGERYTLVVIDDVHDAWNAYDSTMHKWLANCGLVPWPVTREEVDAFLKRVYTPERMKSLLHDVSAAFETALIFGEYPKPKKAPYLL